MQEIFASLRYLVFSCDEITTIGNQSWISIHCYLVQYWCCLFVLISLEQIIEGGRFDNLTQMIMDVMQVFLIHMLLQNYLTV
jgi:hypothetical protein